MKNKETEFKQELIVYDKQRHDRATEAYNKKQSIKEAILKEVVRLLPNVALKETNLFNKKKILQNFYALVEQNFSKQNPMKLPGVKLCSLYDLEVNQLKILENQYQQYKKYTIKPLKSQFCKLTQNDAQNKRLNRCEDIIKFFNDTWPNGELPKFKMVSFFKELNYDNISNSFVPNPDYILKD